MRSHLKKRRLISFVLTAAATFGIPLVTSAPAMAAQGPIGSITVCNWGTYNLYWDLRAENNTMIGGGDGSDLQGDECVGMSLYPEDGQTVRVYLIARDGGTYGDVFRPYTATHTSINCTGAAGSWSCSTR